jgi:hypothetical protein
MYIVVIIRLNIAIIIIMALPKTELYSVLTEVALKKSLASKSLPAGRQFVRFGKMTDLMGGRMEFVHEDS